MPPHCSSPSLAVFATDQYSQVTSQAPGGQQAQRIAAEMRYYSILHRSCIVLIHHHHTLTHRHNTQGTYSASSVVATGTAKTKRSRAKNNPHEETWGHMLLGAKPIVLYPAIIVQSISEGFVRGLPGDKDLLDCNICFGPLKPPFSSSSYTRLIRSFLSLPWTCLLLMSFLCSAPWGMPYTRDESITRSSTGLVSATCVA